MVRYLRVTQTRPSIRNATRKKQWKTISLETQKFPRVPRHRALRLEPESLISGRDTDSVLVDRSFANNQLQPRETQLLGQNYAEACSSKDMLLEVGHEFRHVQKRVVLHHYPSKCKERCAGELLSRTRPAISKMTRSSSIVCQKYAKMMFSGHSLPL